jgi:hypothetical protein
MMPYYRSTTIAVAFFLHSMNRTKSTGCIKSIVIGAYFRCGDYDSSLTADFSMNKLTGLMPISSTSACYSTAHIERKSDQWIPGS